MLIYSLTENSLITTEGLHCFQWVLNQTHAYLGCFVQHCQSTKGFIIRGKHREPLALSILVIQMCSKPFSGPEANDKRPMSVLLHFLALHSRGAASKWSTGNSPWPVPFPEPCPDLSGREPACQGASLPGPKPHQGLLLHSDCAGDWAAVPRAFPGNGSFTKPGHSPSSWQHQSPQSEILNPTQEKQGKYGRKATSNQMGWWGTEWLYSFCWSRI